MEIWILFVIWNSREVKAQLEYQTEAQCRKAGAALVRQIESPALGTAWTWACISQPVKGKVSR